MLIKGDIVQIKEYARPYYEHPLHLYIVTFVSEYYYSIRSINDRSVSIIVPCFEVEKVRNFCTMFPDFCLGKRCCFRHDKRWIRAGGKIKGDILLYRCVSKQARKCDSFIRHIPRLLGALMFLGVNTPIGWCFYWRAQKTGIMQ